MRPLLSALSALALLAVAAAAAPPQSAPPRAPLTFGSEVELVTVDAVVVDKKGVPVLGLRRDDFTLAEEGVPQRIVSFEAVQPSTLATTRPPRPPVISTNIATAARLSRLFAIVFDDMHMTPLQAYRAKLVIAEFLKVGVQEGDRVLLLSTSGGAWWSARMTFGREQVLEALKRCEGRIVGTSVSQDQMTDYEAMAISTLRDQQLVGVVTRRFESAGLSALLKQDEDSPKVTDMNPYIDTRAREAYDLALMRDRLALDALNRLLEALATGKGRKSLILVSQGFIFNPSLTQFREVVSAARRANTAIYFLGTRGLDVEKTLSSAEIGSATFASEAILMHADLRREHEGAELLADQTGGFSIGRTGDLAAGLMRITNEARGYYLLGYSPRDSVQDGSFRRITVRVNRRGVTVRARRGYFAPSPGLASSAPKTEDEIDPQLQHAVDAPFDEDEIPLRMTAYAFGETLLNRAKVNVVADIDIRGLAYAHSEGRLQETVDVLLLVSHLETGEVLQDTDRVEMRLKPETLAKTPWYPVIHEYDLGPGHYEAKLVAREQNGKTVGSVMHFFSLGDLGAFRASTPILSDVVKSLDDGSNMLHAVPLARRSFHARGSLYCQIEVFNAARDAESGKPKVLCGHKLVAHNGRVVREAPATPIAVPATGIVSRLFSLSVDGLSPGEYELQLTLADAVAGKTLELREPFTLEPAAAAAEAR